MDIQYQGTVENKNHVLRHSFIISVSSNRTCFHGGTWWWQWWRLPMMSIWKRSTAHRVGCMFHFLFPSYLVGSAVWRIHNDEEWLPGERKQVTGMKATTQQTRVVNTGPKGGLGGCTPAESLTSAFPSGPDSSSGQSLHSPHLDLYL